MSGTTMGSSSSSRSLEEEAKRLRCIQSNIRRHLEEAEKNRVETELDKVHLKLLWKILYNAEDALDDYHDWMACRKRKHPDSAAEQSSCRGLSLLCVEANIRKVLKDFDDHSNILKALRSSPREIRGGHPWRRDTEGHLPSASASNLRAMEDDKNDILKILVSPSEEYIDDRCRNADSSLLVFPVTGPAGIGKTTLVQHIYNDTSIPFEMKIWVWCDPNKKDGNAVELLRSLYDERGVKKVNQLAQAQENTISKLRGNRFLLVLDGACSTDREFWNKFWSPFLHLIGRRQLAQGSIAIVTTRNLEVIENMPTDLRRASPYFLYPLGFDDCWSIFMSSVIRSGHAADEIDDELMGIGKEIVRKCQGFPRAIHLVATKLRDSSKDPEQWNKQLASVSRDSSGYWMESYCQLKPQAKRCLMYCTLFPKQFPFDRDYLIKLWTSQGFTIEGSFKDSGLDYFKDLQNRFFLVYRKEPSKYYMPAMVHDLLHDTEEFMTADLFSRTEDENTMKKSFRGKRHLSFTGRMEEAHLPEPEILQHLRSILFIYIPGRTAYMKVSNIKFKDVFQYMGHLKTLEFSYTDIEKLPEEIIYLRNLCFLGLNGTRIEALPDSVCKLYKLQALELKHCRKLCKLPESIEELTNLRHLHLNSENKLSYMPEGLGKLTNLQTLPLYVIGERNGEYRGLRELVKLKKLRKKLHITGLCHASDEDLNSNCLEEKKDLKTLRLCWSSPSLVGSGSKLSRSHDFSGLKPHSNLENLIIQFYSGNNLPKWISDPSFKRLKFIYLKNCLNCESLPSLGQLPSLKRIEINCPGVKKIDDRFCGCGSFPSLEELTFSGMWNLQEWTVDNVNNFPKLEMLKFDNCPTLKGIPKCSFECLKSMYLRNSLNCKSLPPLGHLPSLKRLDIINCPEVEEIDDWFCGGGGFPSLEKLTFSGMWKLHTWTRMNVKNFPLLQELEFENCPRFKGIPEITSLISLSLMRCEGPIVLGEQPNLKHLWIEECGILNLHGKLKGRLEELDSLFVVHCYHDIHNEFKIGPDANFFEDDCTLCFYKTSKDQI